MCRSLQEDGRRCAKTEATHAAERAASKRYYQRSKARAVVATLREAGVPAMDDLEMPVTFHVGREGRRLDLIESGRQTGRYKPAGLWTAPGRVEETTGQARTAWTDRSAGEGSAPGATYATSVNDETHEIEYTPTWAPPPIPVYAIRATPGAVIVRVDTVEDYAAVDRRYPGFSDASVETDRSRRAAAWDVMRADGVSAVFISRDGTRARDAAEDRSPVRQAGFAHSVDGWDVSSVVWLSNHHMEVAGEHGYPRYEEAPGWDPERDSSYTRFVQPQTDPYPEGPDHTTLLAPRTPQRRASAQPKVGVGA